MHKKPSSQITPSQQEVGTAALAEQLPAAILSFQPDVVELEYRAPAQSVRRVFYTVLSSLIVVVAWASLSKVERVVTARGKLITTDKKYVLQPIATGVVRSFYIQVGMLVSEGQLLATSDPTFTDADLRKQEAEHQALFSQLCRLRAEYDGVPYQPDGQEIASEAAMQSKLYSERQAAYHSVLNSIETCLGGVKTRLTAPASQIESLSSKQKTVREIEKAYENLMRRSEGSRVQYLEAQERRFAVDAEQDRLLGEMESLKKEQEAIEAEGQLHKAQWRNQTVAELQEVRLRFESTRQKLEKIRRMSRLLELRAPADGIVLERSEHSVGAVVREAEQMITLAPKDSLLLAQVKASDIGRVRLRDTARLKLDAFPFQRHGTLPAHLSVVTEDAFIPDVQDQTSGINEAYYLCHLTIDGGGTLRDVPKDFRLIPGMTVTAEIKVGSRRVH